jgi:hypothetical protein
MNFHVQHSSTILVVIKFIHISKNIIYTFCVHFYVLCPFKNISSVYLIPHRKNWANLNSLFWFLLQDSKQRDQKTSKYVCVWLTTHENENRKNSIKYLENFQFYNINSSLWESHSVRRIHRNWTERE